MDIKISRALKVVSVAGPVVKNSFSVLSILRHLKALLNKHKQKNTTKSGKKQLKKLLRLRKMTLFKLYFNWQRNVFNMAAIIGKRYF